ncbi:MAG: ABC transporter substrate-binding protein [Deltaproteobacteria bacterium]|nr:ABC transporter substrate-binding protein [Deltaproteobacteria bacterium]
MNMLRLLSRLFIFTGTLALLIFSMAGEGRAARCLYVSSYHAGYVWNDDIEHAIEEVLRGKCELKTFYMDGKRNSGAEFAAQKAGEAKELIDAWKPDVVIAADDNVSKYLVKPYLRDVKIPVVFCGLNWTVEPYGYPYSNTTGMIEVGPIEPLVDMVKSVVPNARQGIFLSADELTQFKEVDLSKKAYGKLGIAITHLPVKTMDEWEAGYLAAQQADFIICGNNAGINDWDNSRAAGFVSRNASRFTVSYLDWMAPFAMLTMAKIAAEQGEWAAKTALLILGGEDPKNIPIVANRRWNLFVNSALLDKAGFVLPIEIVRKAVKVE